MASAHKKAHLSKTLANLSYFRKDSAFTHPSTHTRRRYRRRG